MSFRSGLAVALILVVGPSSSAVRADIYNFTPLCDSIWQTCCDCGVGDRCINWDQPPMGAPVCPDLPDDDDDVIIEESIEIGATPPAVAATIVQSGGTFLLDGDLSIAETAVFDGLFEWQSGSIARATNAPAAITINADLDILGDDDKTFGASGLNFGGLTLTNNSVITWLDEGTLTLSDSLGGGEPATIINPAAGLIDVQTDAAILSTAFGFGVIDNAGTLQKSVADGVSEWSVELNNTGLVHVQTGEVVLTGTGSASGEFTIDDGARLTFAPEFPFEFQPGILFSGDGVAALVDTGSDSGIDVLDVVELNRFRIEESGLIGPTDPDDFGEIRVTELLTMAGGEIFPPVVILAGAELDVEGPDDSIVGDIVIEGAAHIFGGQLVSENADLTIEEGGLVELHDNGSLASAGLFSQPIQNFGTISKSTGPGLADVVTDLDAALQNNETGLLIVSSGTLSINAPVVSTGDIQIDTGTTMRMIQGVTLNGGTLTGGGTLRAEVENVGAVVSPGASAGVLRIAANTNPAISGDYVQGAGGALFIEVGGLEAVDEHDQLVVAGAADLNGELELVRIGTFLPADGDEIVVLVAGDVNGEFSDLTLTNFPAGVSADLVYTADSVVVHFNVVQGDDNVNGNDNDNNNDNDNDNDNNNDNGGDGPIIDCGEGTCGVGGATLAPLALMGLVSRRRRRR